MSRRERPSGSRQRIWTYLLSQKEAKPLIDIISAAGVAANTASTYLSGLKSHGYVTHNKGDWLLEKKTGPLAVLVNARGSFVDLNLDPPMSGQELKEIIAGFKSYRDFAIKAGLGEGYSTRLREMVRGARVVSERVKTAAEKIKPRN